MSQISEVEGTIIYVEKVLNIFGYIPIVSSISGPIRAIMGKIQVIACAVLAVLAFLTGREAMAWRCVICFVHGVANYFRGNIETIPVIGNIACLVYDVLGRFSYSGEKTSLLLSNI
ncbi:MAG: hypothetical protein WCP39_01945 [Chlamydiota bacterium]